MSHRELAEVWLHLEKRTDITNILREAIGKYDHEIAFERQIPDRRASDWPATWELILLCKASFDLQRLYLQSPAPSFESKRYLLRPQDLIGFLLYILQLKDNFALSVDSSEDSAASLVRFVAQTLTSGLRVLQLNREKRFNNGEQVWIVTPQDVEAIKMLQAAMQRSWPSNQDHLVLFLTSEICGRSIQALLRNFSPVDTCSGFQAPDLPDFTENPSRIDRSNVEAVKSSAALLRSGCEDWLPNYWILFDIWWGGIAALTHICSHPPGADGQSGLPALLHSVLQQCSDIIDAFPWGLCKNDTPSDLSIILRTFTAEPYPVCACNSCNCFGSRLQSSPNNALVAIVKQEMRPSNLSFCMKHLHTFLETRNLTLRDSELALTKLSTTLQKDVNDWSQPFSNSDGIAGRATDDGVVYVLDCPQLHPVSPGWLTKKTSNQAIIKAIRDADDVIKLSGLGIICGECEDEHQPKKARLVVPLKRISEQINAQRLSSKNVLREDFSLVSASSLSQMSRPGQWYLTNFKSSAELTEIELQNEASALSRRDVPQAPRGPSPKNGLGESRSPTQVHTRNGDQTRRSSLSPSLAHQINLATPSAKSEDHLHTGSPGSDTTKSRSSKRVLGLGLKSVVHSLTPSISSQSFNTQLPASHEFSADSRTVLIWTEAELAVYSIENGLRAIVPLRGIRYSSAGAEKLGLVLTEGEIQKLSIRRLTEPSVILWDTELPSEASGMLNLAMTADDKQVAVRLPRVIRLYDITPHNDYRELKLSIPAPSVETQVMSFSRDGRTLAAASQLKEDAYVSSFDVASAKRKGSVHFKMAAGAVGFGEHGFSAIACHTDSHSVLIAAFKSNFHPSILDTSVNPIRSISPPDKSNFGTRIQCAAANLTSPPRYLVVNNENKVYLFKLLDARNHRWETKKLKVLLSDYGRRTIMDLSDNRMSATLAPDDTVHLFWLERSGGTLKGRLLTTGEGVQTALEDFNIPFGN